MKNGSNIRSRISAGMPAPASVTRSDTASPSNGSADRHRVEACRARPRRALRRRGGDACTALSARLNTARCSRSSSPSTHRALASGTTHDDAHRLVAVRMRRREARRAARERGEIDRLRARDAHAREVEKLRQQARQPVGLAHHEHAERFLIVATSAGMREICSTALRIDASGFLISCASDALSSAMPSSRSARRRSDSMRFWSEMSWKIAVAVRPAPASSLLGVGRRHADRESASPTVETIPSPRVVRTFCSAARRSASASSGATAPIASRTGSPEALDEVDAEELLGHRVGVEQAAGASTVTTPLRMLCRMSSAWRRVCSSAATSWSVPSPLSRSSPLRVAHAERDEGEDAELQPDARLDEPAGAEEEQRRRRSRARCRARR